MLKLVMEFVILTWVVVCAAKFAGILAAEYCICFARSVSMQGNLLESEWIIAEQSCALSGQKL
jgi:hypothetical protein